MSTQSVDIAVYTEGRTLIGTVSIPEGLRLSDFLNDRNKAKHDFIKLTNVTINLVDGTKETSKNVYVNKQSITMITTLEPDSTRGIGAEHGYKKYPFVKKLPVRAAILLPGYELSCYVHFTEAREAAIFTKEQNFLPCTDTMVYDVDKDCRWKIDFAAINKNYISCFEEKN